MKAKTSTQIHLHPTVAIYSIGLLIEYAETIDQFFVFGILLAGISAQPLVVRRTIERQNIAKHTDWIPLFVMDRLYG